MSKKKSGGHLGRTIIKDRFGGKRRKDKDSYLHTSELEDGFEWGRLNLQSVTDQSNLDDFLATAELAGTEFTAEKLNVEIVNTPSHTGLLSADEAEKVKDTQEKHKTLLTIPRRPAWDASTTPDELERRERDTFLEWRRGLAELQDIEGLLLTPFEKNLGFWRQLWRVIERSDVVVQIVDARNPLLFRCVDLEKYVKEVGKNKMNLVLVNKADYLTEEQRVIWAEYFGNIGVKVMFWSAVTEMDRIKQLAAEAEAAKAEEGSQSESEEEETDEEPSNQNEEDICGDLEVDPLRGEQSMEEQEYDHVTSPVVRAEIDNAASVSQSQIDEGEENSNRECDDCGNTQSAST